MTLTYTDELNVRIPLAACFSGFLFRCSVDTDPAVAFVSARDLPAATSRDAAYDEGNLYFAFRCYDPNPGGIQHALQAHRNSEVDYRPSDCRFSSLGRANMRS